MARSFSVTRRRDHLVDLNIRARANVAAYQFFAATNFDAVFTQFETVPAAGLKSVSVPDIGMSDSQFRGLTRFLFDPSDYTVSVAAVDNTKPFWLQIKQVSTAGIVGSAEAAQLVIPYPQVSYAPVVVKGTAPNEAGISTSQELQLPYAAKSFDVMNLEAIGGKSLFLAFDPNGPEIQIDPQAAYSNLLGLVSVIFVRGGGGTVAFQSTGIYPYQLSG